MKCTQVIYQTLSHNDWCLDHYHQHTHSHNAHTTTLYEHYNYYYSNQFMQVPQYLKEVHIFLLLWECTLVVRTGRWLYPTWRSWNTRHTPHRSWWEGKLLCGGGREGGKPNYADHLQPETRFLISENHAWSLDQSPPKFLIVWLQWHNIMVDMPP